MSSIEPRFAARAEAGGGGCAGGGAVVGRKRGVRPLEGASPTKTDNGNETIPQKPAEGAGETPPPPLPPPPPVAIQPKRFHGTVTLDTARVGRDAGRIAEEVIAHLSGLVGARVTVTLEIEAEIPSGASDHVVRTVTENSRTLKFTSQGFEKE